MISGRPIGYATAVLASLSVFAIFLFPGVQGPYSVVHGPATALQAARAASRLRIATAQSPLNSQATGLISPPIALSWMSLSDPKFQSVFSAEVGSVLRC
jgi:hypothetical protein